MPRTLTTICGVQKVDLKALMVKAINAFNALMQEACNGQGCDRHMLALFLTALENGRGVPELFTDEAYRLSGGGGNFVLSTSLIGNANQVAQSKTHLPRHFQLTTQSKWPHWRRWFTTATAFSTAFKTTAFTSRSWISLAASTLTRACWRVQSRRFWLRSKRTC